jgi:hypothetical protein
VVCLLLCALPLQAKTSTPLLSRLPWSAPSPKLTDSALMDRLERAALRYFWDEADPVSGLIKDRAANWGPDLYHVCNIAPTGLGLGCLAVGARRGWIPRARVVERVRRTLSFVERKVPNDHGWMPRFLEMRTGQRVWNCETSTIDTTLCLWGARLAARLLKDPQVTAVTERLCRRVDWNYVTTRGGTEPGAVLVAHGIDAKGTFLGNNWDNYSEGVLIYFLGLGAPEGALPRSSWAAWRRNWGSYQGQRTYECPCLFTFLMPMALLDVRGLKDPEHSDLWGATVRKVRADQLFCAVHPEARAFIDAAGRCSNLPLFGVSACDGPPGYRAYGAPPGPSEWDGTLHPPMLAATALTSPGPAMRGVRALLTLDAALAREEARSPERRRANQVPLGPREPSGASARGPLRLWGKYGLPGGANLQQRWVARDQIGLDLAIEVLALEDRRTGLPWRALAGDPWVRRAMAKIGSLGR